MKLHAAEPTQKQLDARLYTLKNDMFSVRVEPLGQATYRGEHEIATLGPLSIARISTTGAIVSRKHEEVLNPDFKRYSFIVILEGEMILSHHLGIAELKPGQFLFLDNNLPRTMYVQKSISIMLISLPGIVLKRHFKNPERFEGLVLNSKQVNQNEDPLFSIILDSWDKLKAGCMREFAPMLSDKLLRRLADFYATQISHKQSRKEERINAAKALVEEQLHHANLTVESLAQEMGVSSRYLRALFSHSEKISHYILRRRLEECANCLEKHSDANVSITEVAFNCGFNNIAHFCRTFKKYYKITPREYRRVHLRTSAWEASA